MNDDQVAMLATVMADVRYMREALDDHAEASKAARDAVHSLEKRVDEVEKKATKFSAWVAGALATVTALSHRKEIIALLLGAWCFLIAGCAPPPVAVRETRFRTSTFDWLPQNRPLMVVMSVELPVECMASVFYALDFWQQHGVTYAPFLGLVPENLTSVQELVLGEIVVSAGGPQAEQHAAATQQLASGGHMLAARITFHAGWCSPIVAAHEFGHALGLPDVDSPGNVMHWLAQGVGTGVTAAQAQAVR